MKNILSILMWSLMGLALILFIGIFFFVFKEDTGNAFICMILGWTSYLGSFGVKMLRSNLFSK